MIVSCGLGWYRYFNESSVIKFVKLVLMVTNIKNGLNFQESDSWLVNLKCLPPRRKLKICFHHDRCTNVNDE